MQRDVLLWSAAIPQLMKEYGQTHVCVYLHVLGCNNTTNAEINKWWVENRTLTCVWSHQDDMFKEFKIREKKGFNHSKLTKLIMNHLKVCVTSLCHQQYLQWASYSCFIPEKSNSNSFDKYMSKNNNHKPLPLSNKYSLHWHVERTPVPVFTCIWGVQCRHYHGGGSVGSSYKWLRGGSGDQCALRGGDH